MRIFRCCLLFVVLVLFLRTIEQRSVLQIDKQVVAQESVSTSVSSSSSSTSSSPSSLSSSTLTSADNPSSDVSFAPTPESAPETESSTVQFLPDNHSIADSTPTTEPEQQQEGQMRGVKPTQPSQTGQLSQPTVNLAGQSDQQLVTFDDSELKTYLKSDSTTFDPIKKNGEYFVNWPQPKFAFVFTGFLEGYLEPCGCAGMLEMKGGLSRRFSLLGSLREKGWPLITIDGGDFCGDFGGKQAELKLHFIAEALRKMKYDAIGIGKNELRFSAEELLTLTVNLPDVKSPFTAVNIAPFEFNPSMIAPYLVLEQGGIRVGVVSIITKGLLEEIDNQEIVKTDPIIRVREILPALEKENCDYLVLISHGKRGQVLEETEEFLKSFPKKFGIVVVSDPPAEPPRQAPKVIDGRYFIEVGEKGKFAVVLGVFDDAKNPVRYQAVAIDSRYANSPIITEMMQDYQDRLRELGPKGLGIKDYVHPRFDQLGKYIGSKECQSCHEISYDVWKKSKHANAWKSLTTTSVPARTFDPDCVGCHVVGWNPAEHYPYTSGYNIAAGENAGKLVDVGCESCHGPGEMHKIAEMGKDKTAQAESRLAVRLQLENAQKSCITCHDGDNSPAFQFDSYWKQIEHKEDVE
ncbi:MAG: multiheme c-type cytochrome [Thermoguttaceae bacterium]